ncbi:PPOX class F420-dependent oxidoreductase [Pseudonocardia sp. T1-2H]|uniref:PPOX class F420-dependent oxidoreductase n=1 Tax=Pseudonocardia sp. T1-2H TaxID=3128899 RepID=UPI0031016567
MPRTADGPELLPETEELATGTNFAAVSTVFPSGRIQTQTIWVHVANGKIVLNTETHRAKARNVQRDPRITVLIRDENDPYRYAEVRGRVTDTTTGPEARAHVDELSQKYTGRPYPPENIKSERIILWITPERQTYIDQGRGLT